MSETLTTLSDQREESGGRSSPAAGGKPSWWCRHPCPPYPPPTGCRRVFIPFYGYLDADDEHRKRVDRFFELPMLIMALLVLPLLVIEWLQWQRDYTYLGQEVLEHPVALVAASAAMVIIWLAFLVEFVIKITIAQSRLAYAQKHWLDIVIIALPLLRPLRVAQVLRPARALRVFTLRGVLMRLLRTGVAVLLSLEFVRRFQSRFVKSPPAPAAPDYTQWSRAALIAEIHRLNKLLASHEARLKAARRTPADREPSSA